MFKVGTKVRLRMSVILASTDTVTAMESVGAYPFGVITEISAGDSSDPYPIAITNCKWDERTHWFSPNELSKWRKSDVNSLSKPFPRRRKEAVL